MPARKRKSTAVAEASQDVAATDPSTPPSAARRKRTKRSTATASQQLQVEQEEAELAGTQIEEQGTVNVASQQKKTKKAGEGLTVNVEKPHTPPDTLSPDVGHPPRGGLSPALGAHPLREEFQETVTVQTRHHQVAKDSQPTNDDGEDAVLGAVVAMEEPAEAAVTSSAVVVSQKVPVVLPDPTVELEVERFEQVTTSLNTELGAVRAELQILIAELQTLGFTEIDASSGSVLAKIRTAFGDARAQLNELLPDADANSYHNGDLLGLLLENIRSLLTTVREHRETIQQSRAVTHVLKEENDGLVDRLAEAENRKREIQNTLHKTDMLVDKRAKEMVELEEEIQELKDTYNRSTLEIEERNTVIEELNEDIADYEAAADELQQKYDDAVQSLGQAQETQLQAQKDYEERLQEQERDHATVVRELEADLAEEVRVREAIENDDEDKAARIAELEAEIEDLQGDIDTLKVRLTEANDATKEQSQQYEALEIELQERETSIDELKIKVDDAEQNLVGVMQELEELRAVTKSERRQREAAEEELDQRNEDISELSARLKEAGIQANELRGKLFEAQQRRESELKELEAIAAADRTRLEEDLAVEQEARAAMEQRVAELTETVIPDFEVKIRNLELELEALLAARDAALAEKQSEVAKLQAAIKDGDDRHTQYVERKGEELQSLRGDIKQMSSMLADRDRALDSAQLEIEELEKAKTSLEARVESEAIALLEEQGAHADAISSLNGSLKARDVEIGKLLRERELAAEEYEETIFGRDDRIHDLEELAESRKIEVDALKVNVEDLHQKLVQSVKIGREAVSKVNAIQAAAHNASQEAEQSLLHDTEALMQDVDVLTASPSVVHVSEPLTPQRRSSRVTQQTKVAKKSTKKRTYHDSGVFEMSSEPGDSTQEMVEV